MVIISQRDYDHILAHTLKAIPQECCGLIVGKKNKDGMYHVHSIQPTDNVASGDKTTEFEIDPKVRFDLMRAERESRLGENTLIGFYHSHPNGLATPSETDRSMVYEAELLWLIATVNEIKAFSFNEKIHDFFEVPIQLKQ